MAVKIDKRLPPGTIEQWLESGELHRRARAMPADATQADFARSLGITPDAYTCARIRFRRQGKRLPGFEELRSPDREDSAGDHARERAAVTDREYRESDTPIDSSIPNEGTRAPNLGTRRDEDLHTYIADTIARKWPSVEKFDATDDSPPVDAVPPGHAIKGVSTFVGPDGEVKGQWIKTTRESDPIADIVAAFASIKDELPRADSPIPAPARCSTKQLAAYLYGDCHVGMHAWRGDAGSNFDLKIAEQNLTELTARLVDLAPSTERALIVNIGDYFHSDNRGNTTTKGTPVDVDGRWAKVLAVGIRIMRRNIERALQKHQHVTVINEIGNHDTHTSMFLALALAQFYESEPRVHIDVSPEMFHYYRFGKVLIMTHHGHLVKPQDLPGIMACDRAEDWGETEHRYAITGHVHHERSREFPGVFWRSLRATATSDAWHRGQGYRSVQELCLEVFDAEEGLINRHNVGVPKNLGAAA